MDCDVEKKNTPDLNDMGISRAILGSMYRTLLGAKGETQGKPTTTHSATYKLTRAIHKKLLQIDKLREKELSEPLSFEEQVK